MRRLIVVPVAVVFVVLVACGDDDSSTSTGDTDDVGAVADDAGADMDMDMDMDMDADAGADEDTDAGDDHASFDFGEPADAADADRTIEVEMTDEFAYDPDSIEVTAAETIAFEVHNAGEIVHEFVIGDKALQDDHEREMQEMEGGMMMHDEPNAVAVEPGGTKTLAFHFTEAAELEYACHQPGHYDAGMVAPLTVS